VTDERNGQNMLRTGSVVAGNETIHRALLKNLQNAREARAGPAASA
jgi:hypothetical protein